MCIRYKITIVLFLLVILPAASLLYLIETEHIRQAKSYLSLGLAISISMLIPMSDALAYFIAIKELKQLNRFCLNIRAGKYDCFFELPNENEEEAELIRLKRNMNRMLRMISNRSAFLQSRIVESEEIKKEFEDLSLKDPLTCVYNRRYFDLKIRECAEQCRHFFLVLIDVDFFKQVNDRLGHQAGDSLLIRLGQILTECTRKESDFPFRYGGDEFGVILSGCDAEKAVQIAERIRCRFEASAVGNSTLSIGIAEFSCTQSSMEKNVRNLIKGADKAVYLSKHNGRNQITALLRNDGRKTGRVI